MSQVQTPISYGELLDKITILEIKSERMTDEAKLKNVRHELGLLRKVWDASGAVGVDDLHQGLKAINERLWVIEDDIRDKEKAQAFDEQFIDLARSVYFTNDQRAEIKKEINLRLGSELVEEKSYADLK